MRKCVPDKIKENGMEKTSIEFIPVLSGWTSSGSMKSLLGLVLSGSKIWNCRSGIVVARLVQDH